MKFALHPFSPYYRDGYRLLQVGGPANLLDYDTSLKLRLLFLATLVALHLTPVSESVSQWAEFRTRRGPSD